MVLNLRATFGMGRNGTQTERRQWARIQVAIPVFIRNETGDGDKIIDTAMILNISACGALVATRVAMMPSAEVFFEVPSAPLPQTTLKLTTREFGGRVARVEATQKGYLLGVRFNSELAV